MKIKILMILVSMDAFAAPLPEVWTRTEVARAHLYEPIAPLWSDGLLKERYIDFDSSRAQIDTANPWTWKFPEGTRFTKIFKTTESQIEEIRLISRTNNVWEFRRYEWDSNKNQGNWVYGETIDNDGTMRVIRDRVTRLPSVSCNACHRLTPKTNNGFGILGMTAPQLKPETEKWMTDQNRFTQMLPQVHSFPAAGTDLEIKSRKALEYFYGNCRSCHRPGGSAEYTRMNFDYDPQANSISNQPGYVTTVGVRSGFQTPGSRITLKIDPQHPESSSVYYRMNSEFQGIRMPLVGSKKKDPEGLQSVKEWIEAL